MATRLFKSGQKMYCLLIAYAIIDKTCKYILIRQVQYLKGKTRTYKVNFN